MDKEKYDTLVQFKTTKKMKDDLEKMAAKQKTTVATILRQMVDKLTP